LNKLKKSPLLKNLYSLKTIRIKIFLNPIINNLKLPSVQNYYLRLKNLEVKDNVFKKVISSEYKTFSK